MKDIMLAELPVEQRAQILKDSCDKIEERSYLSKYDQEETNLLRAELANVSIQLGTIQEELDGIKSDYKGKLKPLQERIDKILYNLKNGGEYVRGECYKFIDQEEERVGWYTPDGYLLEERPITQEERQRTVQMEIRRTGTDN
ncbi:MAG: hypothetical protein [Bacteriophage sp.]|jgi:hypothetical protein|nr:MAG: hypothetical protein [Bacteriophage sp.]DAJ35859.1 MAG TPA: hypothetical protein [Caudoviricetes sp.]